MEMIQYRLDSLDIQSYHTAYRTVAMNVTGPQLNATRIYFEDKKIFYEADLLKSTNLYFLWLLSDFIPFANSLERPWMIVNGDAFLFDDLKFTDAELRWMREKGLYIFMYEPLFLLNPDRSWPWTGNIGLPIFVELDEISKLQKRFDIPVHVCICELDLPKYLKDNNFHPNLKIHGFSTLLQHETTFRKAVPWPPSSAERIEKHILSMNFRYESVREMLVSFLAGKNYLDKCHVSFFHSHEEKEFRKRLPFQPEKLAQWETIKKGMDILPSKLPLTLETTHTELQHPVQGSIPDMRGQKNRRDFAAVREQFMTTAFAFAYCESRPFTPRGEMSEKTMDAIQAMKPFVVFASAHFLKKLRELGFKTFSKWWSEDYDDIEDPGLRYEKFLATVDYICSQDLETLRRWTREMEETVTHNRVFFLRHLLPTHIQSFKNEIGL